jgi:hypothetical protein
MIRNSFSSRNLRIPQAFRWRDDIVRLYPCCPLLVWTVRNHGDCRDLDDYEAPGDACCPEEDIEGCGEREWGQKVLWLGGLSGVLLADWLLLGLWRRRSRRKTLRNEGSVYYQYPFVNGNMVPLEADSRALEVLVVEMDADGHRGLGRRFWYKGEVEECNDAGADV